MLIAALLALASCAGATTLTYLYLRDTIFWTRACVGICTGFAGLGLLGFVAASMVGMKAAVVVLFALTSLPLMLFRDVSLRRSVLKNINEGVEMVRRAVVEPTWTATGNLLFYVLVGTVLWQLCDRAMFENVQGIFTGLDTNIGDLPFHLSVITSFVHGANLPPQHPEFSGVPITYPFIVDFVTALFVSAGASIRDAFVWQNFLMMLALFGLIHHWSLRLLNDRLAARLTPLLVFLSGGFGWWLFLKESARGDGVVAQLSQLTHDYSIGQPGYRWGNALTTLFVPQRGILLGAGLAVTIWILWLQSWRELDESHDEGEGASPFRIDLHSVLAAPAFRSMTAAGTIAGLLPLVHAHSFIVTMLMGTSLSLLQFLRSFLRKRGHSQASTGSAIVTSLQPIALQWLPFFVFALVFGMPQMLWATHGSAVQSGNFIGWEFGWDHGTENVLWFWITNTGFFIPLLIAALVWHRYRKFIPSQSLFFCFPFFLCFAIPNAMRLAPWVWDNIKVLFYWWLALAPIAALVLVSMWRHGGAVRAAAIALVLMQTAAGGLDVWRAAAGSTERQTFNVTALQFAALVKESTPPQSLILHAPTYNDPIYLTGRRTFLGYPGHLWSHGLDFSARLEDVKKIYSGTPDAAELLGKNRIDFVVVGPLEEAELKNVGVNLNKQFFERYTKVGAVGEYQLYKTAQP